MEIATVEIEQMKTNDFVLWTCIDGRPQIFVISNYGARKISRKLEVDRRGTLFLDREGKIDFLQELNRPCIVS